MGYNVNWIGRHPRAPTMDRWQENPHSPSSKEDPTDGPSQDAPAPEVQVSIDGGVRVVVDNSSYAEQLKKSWWTRTSSHRMGGRQFGMAGMLGLMTAAAILLSFAQWVGFGFFFAMLWMIGTIFAPFVVFLILLFFPGIDRRIRIGVGVAVGLAALVPAGVLIVIDSPPGRSPVEALFSMGFGLVLCAWVPQILWLRILFAWRPIRRATAAAPDDEEHGESSKPTGGDGGDSLGLSTEDGS